MLFGGATAGLLGAGTGDEGHLLQVAAQYPPAGALAVNMKGSLHRKLNSISPKQYLNYQIILELN